MDSVTVLQNSKKKNYFNFFPEINDTTKEKFIYQMAYRCQPPEPNLDLDQLLKRRKAKKVELEVTRSSREAECKYTVISQITPAGFSN